MQNAEHFFESMKKLDSNILDFADAVSYAMGQVPKVNYDCWFGEIGGYGVYFANSHESRWFPSMDCSMVATIIAGELL